MSLKTKILTYACLIVLFVAHSSFAEAQDYTCTDVGGATSLETAFALPFLDASINAEYCDPATWYSFSLQSGEGITVALTAHINQGNSEPGTSQPGCPMKGAY